MQVVNNAIETPLNEHDVARITGLSIRSVRSRNAISLQPDCYTIGRSIQQQIQRG